MNKKSINRITGYIILGLLVLSAACSPLVVIVQPTSIALSPTMSSTALPSPTLQPTTTLAALSSINGWVWHDECVIFEGEGGSPSNLNPGCIEDAGGVHADGLMTANELPLEGIKVSLGSGACPSTGLAEMTTIATDLSYSFSGLRAGTYCVSIDPAQEQNAPLLLPGNWTYPSLTYGVAGTTVELKAGENKFDVNFGWDYQFLPAIEQPAGTPTSPATPCQDSAQYITDDGIDGTTYSPNTPFTKTWTVKNTGSCYWDDSYLVSYMSGAIMTQQPGYFIVQPGQTVAPGQTVNISIGMTSPVDDGNYRSNWGLKRENGQLIPVQGGVNGNSFYVKIKVRNNIGAVDGQVTAASIDIELEQGSGATCTANSTYFVHAYITADGPATAAYEISSTAGQIAAGYFQDANNGSLSPTVSGTVVFDQADTKAINLRFVGPYPYPNDITVVLRVNGGEFYNAKLSCQS
jgi:hypothetical protein